MAPHGGHIFRRIKIFANNFSKGSPKEHSCEIISKSDQRFQRRFSKNSLKKLENSILLPWQPEFLMESNCANIFKEDHRRNISANFGSNWPSSLGGVDV